ncbi:amidohydrolase [uncultured Ferrimonas sp.]|uniref:amidohydrolase n=1 Tax=uncultured Ferrimonas sp. TaxID=432640 RepID=UPI00262520EE|nr:amidohydrolase [uncultured Ferrimonas sp.]
MTKLNTLLALVAIAISPASHSHDLLPGQQAQAQLISNATVHTPEGVLTNTDVLLQAGKIAAIGTDLAAANATVLDASGKHLYPTLIGLDNQIGLTEIGAVRATVDSREVGLINPQLRAASAFNIESEVLPTLRANGIGYAQLTPKGGMLAGQSALVQLDGWNVHDAMVAADTGVHLYWPDARLAQGKQRQEGAEHYARQHQRIIDAFTDASHYLQVPRQQIDTRWQAMAQLMRGQSSLFVHANQQRQMEHAIALAQQFKLQLVIVGGFDSYLMTDSLKAANVAVIYTHGKGLPRHADQPYDLAFQIPAMLADAGVEFALAFSGSWESRNLAFVAGQAVAFGLDKTAALNAISATPAKLLGQPRLGRIEVGAPASVILSRGDLFDPSQHGVEQMWLAGKAINLDNRHQRLYQKYQQRYQQQAQQ